MIFLSPNCNQATSRLYRLFLHALNLLFWNLLHNPTKVHVGGKFKPDLTAMLSML